jgi:hypothetical protein
MPIKGLSDRGMSFPTLGHIRKGAPKTGEGESTRIGEDLSWLRAEFDEGEAEAAKLFHSIYGDQPREIRVVLPFNEIERFFECWQEAYIAGTMLHRCDGEYVQWARDAGTGQITVKDWKSVLTGERVLCGGKPVATSGGGKARGVFCKRTGRLKVILPELKRLACMIVHTSSAWDVANLNGQLEWYRWMAGGRLTGLTFLLKRKPVQISTPSSDGKRVRRGKWLLSLEADPEWVGSMLSQLKSAILSEGPALTAPTLPMLEGVLEGQLEVEMDEEEPEDDIPEPMPTEGVAPSPGPEPGGGKVVGFIQNVAAWQSLLTWAIGQGFYEAGDRGAPIRMQHVLKAGGMGQFSPTTWDRAIMLLSEHYKKGQ